MLALPQRRQNKQILSLNAIDRILLLLNASFHHPSSAIGTAGGNDAAEYQEEIPQQKGDEFVGVAAVVFITSVAAEIRAKSVIVVEVCGCCCCIGHIVVVIQPGVCELELPQKRRHC